MELPRLSYTWSKAVRDLNKVCGSGARSGETPGFRVGGSPPWGGGGVDHHEVGQVPFTSTASGLIHTGGRQDHCRKTSRVGVRGREERT